MKSALSASRLPDLPNVGYSGLKAKITSDVICNFMRNAERERALLLSIVVDGRDKWLKTAGKMWKSSVMLIDNDVLDAIFRYFVMQAGPNPAQQLLILHGQMQQNERERWDGRQRTREMARKSLANSLGDLRHSQKRVKGKQWFS